VRTILAALFLVTGAATPTLALADELDGPEARLAWSMGFGGAADAQGYSVTLAYRDAGVAALPLAQWQVAGDVGLARVAGLPVLAHNFRTNQTDDPIAYGNSPIAWGWWVVSGIVVTAVVLEAADSDDDPVSGTGSGS